MTRVGNEVQDVKVRYSTVQYGHMAAYKFSNFNININIASVAGCR